MNCAAVALPHVVSRRRMLALFAAAAGLGVVAVPLAALEHPALEAALGVFTGGATPRPDGLRFEIAPLVENGNAVPVRIVVDSPMTAADHVRRIALFTARNPRPEVAVFHLGPRAGRAEVATRIRLARSQIVVAVAALSDGRFVSAQADVVVTLAACIEELGGP